MTQPHGVCPDTEAWIELPSGSTFAFPSSAVSPEGCNYVRVLTPDGLEVGYWDSQEWAVSPVEVMGAICGAMAADVMAAAAASVFARYYQFGPNTTFPEGVEFDPYDGLRPKGESR